MKKFLLIILLIIPLHLQSQNEWRKLSEPYGGQLSYLGKDKAGNLFSIFYKYHLLISKDNGNNWEFVEDSVSSIAFTSKKEYLFGKSNGEINLMDKNLEFVRTIRAKENSNEIVYDLTLDSADNIYSHIGGKGIMFSADFGKSWKEITYYNLLIDSNNYYYDLGNSVFEYSDDLGKSWKFLLDLGKNTTFRPERKIYCKEHNTFVFIGDDNQIIIIQKKDSIWSFEKRSYPASNPYGAFLDDNGDIYIFDYYAIYRSFDGGFNWDIFKILLPERYTIEYAVRSGDKLIFGSMNKGILELSASSKEFIPHKKGISYQQIYDIDKDKWNNLYILCPDGLFVSTNSGNNWQKALLPGSINYNSRLFCSKSGSVFISYFKLNDSFGIIVSNDNFKSCTFTEFELPESYTSSFAELDGGRIFYGDYSLYYSDDLGKSWKLSLITTGPINSISTFGENRVLLGIYSKSNKLIISTDKGATFNKINFGSKDSFVQDSKFNANGDIYVSTGDSSGIYYSTDMGKSFQNIPPFDKTRPGKIFFDTDGNLYYESYWKLYLYDKLNRSWKKFSQGLLKDVEENEIIFLDNKKAFITTLHDGIYVNDNYSDVKESPESNYNLDIIYPNPASDYIIVRANGHSPKQSEVVIYDVFGNKLLTTKPDANMQINVSALPTGTYFLRAGSEVYKFMVVR